MPIATQCLEPGCKTMTIGPFCIEHDPVAVPPAFPRGRPVAAVAALPEHESPGAERVAAERAVADRLVAV